MLTEAPGVYSNSVMVFVLLTPMPSSTNSKSALKAACRTSFGYI